MSFLILSKKLRLLSAVLVATALMACPKEANFSLLPSDEIETLDSFSCHLGEAVMEADIGLKCEPLLVSSPLRCKAGEITKPLEEIQAGVDGVLATRSTPTPPLEFDAWISATSRLPFLQGISLKPLRLTRVLIPVGRDANEAPLAIAERSFLLLRAQGLKAQLELTPAQAECWG